MRLNHYLLITLLSFSSLLSGQNFSGRILDSINHQPIPYAAIQFNDTTHGVVSNVDGYFSISLDDVKDSDILNISCLGYGSKSIVINALKPNDNIILLGEHLNQLDTVILTGERPSIDSIMARTNRNTKTNYRPNNVSNKIFHRSTAYMDFDELNFDIDKASGMRKSKLESANKSLDSLTNAVINANIAHYTDFAGTFLVLDAKNKKLNVDKATLLLDKKRDFSLETIEKKGKEIILKYLDPNASYKVKTGLFKVEDSLSLKEEMKKEQEENEKKELGVESLNETASGQLNKGFFNQDFFMQQLIDPDLYKFELQDVTFFMNDMVYVVTFKPRRSSSKYAGTHYISSADYGILRTDFSFAKGKRGEKFNLRLLIGVKYIENVSNGTVLFEKNTNGYYQLKYAYREIGRYIYVHRPFKFIENSSSRNKVAFDFLLEGSIKEKHELLLLETKPLSQGEYDQFTQPENIIYQELDQYNPDIWKDYNVIEPLEEMKQFKSSE
ncbi:MAG TPA: carboxypeptidase-like regulatory domain-containing protein [Flavobacteriaceae bacterium]|nr:carboxypeptidase-like regulatory domain-containing protein [Flavobacteriaceae bacterium]